jgi:Uma2 family endonuclease
LLDEFVEEHELGRVGVESGFYLTRDPDTVRGPDVLFVSREKLDPDVEVFGYYEVIPDLVVEIVSPGDTFNEVMDKVDEYLAAGVQTVWVVNMRRRSVIVYPGGQTLTEDDTLTGGSVLPGFAVPVSRLFRRRKK